MTTQVSAFRTHCTEGARNFAQTAVVIDNEAYLDRAADAGPRRAARAPSSVLAAAEPNGTVGQGESEKAAVETSPVSPPAPPSPDAEQSLEPNTKAPDSPSLASPSSVPDDEQTHELNAKALMDAFLEDAIICGLYKPTQAEETVELSVKAAQHADIVILDWYLQDSSSQNAKEIVRRILKSDLDENGRLRLIAIYTAVPDLSSLTTEMLSFIDDDANLKDRFKPAPNGHALSGADTRISFINKYVNKPNVPVTDDTEVVSEKDLPGRLLDEFAFITEGVLATFAVNAIAEVRRAAHHIVAMFQKELDGVYVAHRCSIPHPEDAKGIRNRNGVIGNPKRDYDERGCRTQHERRGARLLD